MPDPTTDLLTVLRTLDPADPPEAVDPASPRARAALERILASDPIDPVAPGRAATPRRTRRRVLVSAAGVLTLAAAAVVALPSLVGGDRAFASWEPQGEVLTAEEQASAAEECRAAQQGGAGAGYEEQLEAAVPVLAESRGAWTTVVLTAPGGFSALCVTDGSTRVFDDWFGSVGVPTDVPAPAPAGLVATDLGTGSLSAGDLSLAAGTAGRDVVAVSYASRTHGTVHGTVAGGRFVLWMPGDDFADSETAGVRVEVTLADGTRRALRLRL